MLAQIVAAILVLVSVVIAECGGNLKYENSLHGERLQSLGRWVALTFGLLAIAVARYL